MEEPVDQEWEWDVLYHFHLFDGSHRDKMPNFRNTHVNMGAPLCIVSTRMGKEAFLSNSIWRTEAFPGCGVFLVPTPTKNQNKTNFSSKIAMCLRVKELGWDAWVQNVTAWRAYHQGSSVIDNSLEPGFPFRSWRNLPHHLPFCKCWVFWHQGIFYQTFGWTESTLVYWQRGIHVAFSWCELRTSWEVSERSSVI